jgi:hypothetical protein
MYSLIQLKTIVSCGRDPARSLPLGRGFLLIPLIMACFAFLPQMQAVLPPQIVPNDGVDADGCYPQFVTAEGCGVLGGPGFGGLGSTAFGWRALFFSGDAFWNTGTGAGALAINTGDENTATGAGALLINLGASGNTAYGAFTLFQNQLGFGNTAVGDQVLFNNDIDTLGLANRNTAVGHFAMNLNVDGARNTAVGAGTLFFNQVDGNTAVGTDALGESGFTPDITAVGHLALNFNDFFFTGLAIHNTAVGSFALQNNTDARNNTAVGSEALEANDISGLALANNNTAVGWESLEENVNAAQNTAVGSFALQNNDFFGDNLALDNTAVGFAALRFNVDGTSLTAVGSGALNSNLIASGCTAVGENALLFNDFFADGFPFGFFNDAVGENALALNVDGFSNNAFGEDALFFNVIAAANTAIGDAAALNNDSSVAGLANFNTAVGFAALFNNVDGGQNTVVGAGAGPNLVAATDFSNTYLGQFVGSTIGGETNTIRIADISIDGFGSAECFIGGIFNNFQPVGGAVVEVTLDLTNDHLGWDVGPSQARPSVPTRSAPAQRGKPQSPAARPQAPARPQDQAMLNDKVNSLQVVVQLQQKQIVALTAQLKQQATQIDKVSAQLELIKPAPRVVENR